MLRSGRWGWSRGEGGADMRGGESLIAAGVIIMGVTILLAAKP